jgi:hypothetical protein
MLATLPDIDTALMVLMGLGHGAYLGKKLILTTSPAITNWRGWKPRLAQNHRRISAEVEPDALHKRGSADSPVLQF